MTEERIKELAVEFAVKMIAEQKQPVPYMSSIEALIRTVAVEGRKEGIDEMRDVAKQYSDYSALQAQLDIEAERLKEQG